MFGNAEVTPGGNALKFYASQRLEIRRVGGITSGEEQVGSRTRLKVVKNKLAPPFRTAEVDVLFGRGISQESEILERAEKAGVIARSGSWFAFGDERLGQGKDNVRDRLRAEPVLKARVLDAMRVQPVAEAK